MMLHWLPGGQWKVNDTWNEKLEVANVPTIGG